MRQVLLLATRRENDLTSKLNLLRLYFVPDLSGGSLMNQTGPMGQVRIRINPRRMRCRSLRCKLRAPAVAADTVDAKWPFDLDKTQATLTGLIEKTLKESGAPSISIALVRGDRSSECRFGYAIVRPRRWRLLRPSITPPRPSSL
jgi:hypothetical protein